MRSDRVRMGFSPHRLDPEAVFIAPQKHEEMWYGDLSIGHAVPWNAKLLLGANNIFNKKPVINYSAGSATGGNSSSSSVSPELPIDRFVYVRYNQAF